MKVPAVINDGQRENGGLPANYERAKNALSQCVSIDECKDWSDKAAALASYAKQAKDDSLHKMALRIQGRAVRRCGELLKQVEPARGAEPEHSCRAPCRKLRALKLPQMPGSPGTSATLLCAWLLCRLRSSSGKSSPRLHQQSQHWLA